MLDNANELLKRYRNLNKRLALEILGSESDRRCPVDKGNLRASRNIYIEAKRFGLEYTANYGIWVHENLNARHVVGEAKFLEKAWAVKKDDFYKILFGE